MTTGPKSGLRADARRNRDQILAAAREVFTAQGPEVPMEEIARAAGVGVGTLYRRFPDRESLIRAVAQESFTQVIDDARAACAEEATGWAALERLVRRSRRLQVSLQLAWSSAPGDGISVARIDHESPKRRIRGRELGDVGSSPPNSAPSNIAGPTFTAPATSDRSRICER